jgi:hypothetical protein
MEPQPAELKLGALLLRLLIGSLFIRKLVANAGDSMPGLQESATPYLRDHRGSRCLQRASLSRCFIF